MGSVPGVGLGRKAEPTFKNVGKTRCNSFGRVRTGGEGKKQTFKVISTAWKTSQSQEFVENDILVYRLCNRGLQLTALKISFPVKLYFHVENHHPTWELLLLRSLFIIFLFRIFSLAQWGPKKGS